MIPKGEPVDIITDEQLKEFNEKYWEDIVNIMFPTTKEIISSVKREITPKHIENLKPPHIEGIKAVIGDCVVYMSPSATKAFDEAIKKEVEKNKNNN